MQSQEQATRFLVMGGGVGEGPPAAEQASGQMGVRGIQAPPDHQRPPAVLPINRCRSVLMQGQRHATRCLVTGGGVSEPPV